jgi:hypothetical protein
MFFWDVTVCSLVSVTLIHDVTPQKATISHRHSQQLRIWCNVTKGRVSSLGLSTRLVYIYTTISGKLMNRLTYNCEWWMTGSGKTVLSHLLSLTPAKSGCVGLWKPTTWVSKEYTTDIVWSSSQTCDGGVYIRPLFGRAYGMAKIVVVLTDERNAHCRRLSKCWEYYHLIFFHDTDLVNYRKDSNIFNIPTKCTYAMKYMYYYQH